MSNSTLLKHLTIALCLAGVAAPADAQSGFRVVAYMHGGSQQPSGIVEGTPGVFYIDGGIAPPAVFSVSAQGKLTGLTSLASGQIIGLPPVSAADGRFYSTYQEGASGYVFSASSQPGKKVYSAQALAPLLTYGLPDSSLLGLGLAFDGSAHYLITATLSGALTTVYEFPPDETTISIPNTAIYGTDGNYYGVSYLQDASGYVYRVTPNGVRTNLYNFPSPTFLYGPHWVPLLQGTDGNLYGATPYGGANGTGTIYKLTLSGQYTLLYTFPKGIDYNPTALIEGSDGNLYGAAWAPQGYSLLFRVTTSGQYTTLLQMRDITCQCQLTQGSDGSIYGTAQVGGSVGAGGVFALDLGLPKPSPRAPRFGPHSGAPGTKVLIWGYNLLSPSVDFNGVPAVAVTSSGPNYVSATVPEGATSGPITVTTPGGTTTTQQSFTVE